MVEASARRLWERGVKLYHGADGERGVSSVLLALEAPPESLIRIVSIGDEPRVFSQVSGEITESGSSWSIREYKGPPSSSNFQMVTPMPRLMNQLWGQL